MIDVHGILLIMVIAAVTVLIRFLPLLVFGSGKEPPRFIQYLGRVLPYAVMGMLVIFCLKGVSLTNAPHGLPELISCSVVVGLHVWKRNTSLSIVCGTVCYMVLVQAVF